MFNPALIKPVIGFTVSCATSRVVGKMIANTVKPTSKLAVVECAIAGGALGLVAGNAASDAVLNEIEALEGVVQGFKEAKNQQES